MALDGPALCGEGDVDQELLLQQGREHGAQVPEVVVPPDTQHYSTSGTRFGTFSTIILRFYYRFYTKFIQYGMNYVKAFCRNYAKFAERRKFENND